MVTSFIVPYLSTYLKLGLFTSCLSLVSCFIKCYYSFFLSFPCLSIFYVFVVLSFSVYLSLISMRVGLVASCSFPFRVFILCLVPKIFLIVCFTSLTYHVLDMEFFSLDFLSTGHYFLYQLSFFISISFPGNYEGFFAIFLLKIPFCRTLIFSTWSKSFLFQKVNIPSLGKS